MYRSIQVEFDATTKIAIATLNRPQAMNAITQSMLDDFDRLWRWAIAEDAVHVIVVRGHMESRAFTSGVDVRGGDDGTDGVVRHWNVFANQSVHSQLGPRMHHLYKPVICAVHGICAGAGLFLVNESDIVLCSDDAEFFDPHLSIGIASASGPIGMSRRVNLGEVLRFTLLSNAERLRAQTALQIGLVTEVTPRDQLWARADALARVIAAYDTVAVQGTLRAIWEGLDVGRRAALERAPLYSDAARASSSQPFQAAAKQAYTVR
ncbi:MAG: enoyl-CoA hydratase/isomerase family protein [Steroidobacteraceae bacterium]